MLTLLLAAAAAGAPAADSAIIDDPDFRCYAAITVSVGVGDGAGKLTDEQRTGLYAIAWYYYGRIDVRYPGADLASTFVRLVSKPDYLRVTLPADGKRCGAEAEQKGKAMQDLGAEIMRRAPLADHRPG